MISTFTIGSLVVGIAAFGFGIHRIRQSPGPLDSSRDRRLAEQIADQIDTHRGHAHSLYRAAWWLERVGLHAFAHRQRHDARLAFRMAAKMQRGLATGAYRSGSRQFPYVEDQCGCHRYCRPGAPS